MPTRPETLRAAIGGDGKLCGRHHTVSLAAMGRALDADLSGARVLLRTRDQLFAALALIELDGVAARIVIAPPDVKPEHLPSVVERAAVDVVVSEDPALAVEGTRFEQLHLPKDGSAVAPSRQSEWVLFTSGTTGVPKMVAHSLEGLSGAIQPAASNDIVWGTFYDIRRYGGLQILLRALLGKASLILSDADEKVGDFLSRLGRHGVTHLTGTPSHWRRALMSPANSQIAPRYVRLSGEIADQAILDSLKARFPDAAMGHAYASTEAGVGFEVTDGMEGFPASYIGRPGPVEMKVEGGTLHLRSPRTASEYVGGGTLKNDGWVDTGDMVERRDERYYFAGRTGGIINVGGLKINPEEVEAVINRYPGVRMSRVSGRKNPITGAIVIAEVVLIDSANDNAGFKQAILEACREKLPAFKVPAMLRFVPALELTAGGKLSRHA
ncbi:MAG TPA: fatty acid--CoA ligase family protein [Rhizomicrobium sp.]|nr:fatty acid--CoA ligase family protein [Rhizomicrobium sp.]